MGVPAAAAAAAAAAAVRISAIFSRHRFAYTTAQVTRVAADGLGFRV